MSLKNIKVLDLENHCSKTVFKNEEILTVLYDLLENSKSWDLGLGYFHLSGFKQLAWPLSQFLINGGKIRVYSNEKLSENDFKTLTNNNSEANYSLSENTQDLFEILQKGEGDLFRDCISYLISSKKLEFKVLIKKDDGYGISHDKNFIFKDETEVVTLQGSANISKTAFSSNQETMAANCSFWGTVPSQKTIDELTKNFEKLFYYGDENWDIVELNSEELKKKFEEYGFHKTDLDSLKSSQKNYKKKELRKLPDSLKKRVENDLSKIVPGYVKDPQFPYDKPHPYQTQAYKKWKKAEYKGLFAMATGTGKTVTAINCLTQEYGKTLHRYIVVVPGEELVHQWSEELENSYFGKVYKWMANGTRDIERSVIDLQRTTDTRINIVVTYASFSTVRFKNIIKEHLHDYTIIFDEVHNLGVKYDGGQLPDLSKCKLIGLSATPERHFGLELKDIKNNYIKEVFDCEVGEYTFQYSMKEAIDNEFLTPYKYHIRFTNLLPKEWDEYKILTNKMHGSDDQGNYEVKLEVALKRARIIGSAHNKFKTTKEIVNELYQKDEQSYTLIFCPEGSTNMFNNTELSSDEQQIELYRKSLDKKFGENLTIESITDKSGNERTPILETFTMGEIDILLSIRILDEGVDIPAIRNGILVTSNAGERQRVQRRGRILRKYEGKDFANLFDIVTLPPKEILNSDSDEFNRIKGLIHNEFRRIEEFNELAINKDEVIAIFNSNPAIKKLQLDYGEILSEIIQQEQEQLNQNE